jgi:hypothetical protein
VQNFVQHLVLSAYEHRHSLHEVGAVQTTNIPLLQSKHSLEQSFSLFRTSALWMDVRF